MILYPAIDLKDGACVRLLRGEMDAATVFNTDPGSQAKTFEEAGFQWIHLVDLNGAFEGKPVNAEAIKTILSSINVPAQLGGGIRDMATIEFWLKAGISRIILGTAAVKNPDLVRDACKKYPGKIAVGIDAKAGMVATEGWAEVSDISATTLAKQFQDVGVSAIIYTDIARDGAMQGPNIEETAKLAQHVDIPVILSGGVSNIDDIKQIKQYEAHGINGAIIGRAMYDGAINPKEALNIAA